MAERFTARRLEERLRIYALTPCEKEDGPLAELILGELEKAGLNPQKDEKGNIIVVKNPDSKTSILVSSHMDTVFGKNPEGYGFGETGSGKIMGSLDNSVGCAINMELALNTSPRIKTYYVFTTGEEIGGDGAKHLIEGLTCPKENYGKPKENPLCITLDVSSDNFGEPFNIENVLPITSIGGVNRVGKMHYGKSPSFSPSGMFDESMVYGRFARAFSVCPIVSGNMHSEACKMERQNLAAAYLFMESLLNSKNLEESVQSVRSSSAFVRKIAEEARELAKSRGCIPTEHVYYDVKTGTEWSAYFVIPHSKRVDESIFNSHNDFVGQMRQYKDGEKIRDEFDVSWGEFTVEATPVLKDHKYLCTVYDYKISIRPPGRLRDALKKMEASYKERTQEVKAWYYEIEAEFSTIGQNPIAQTRDTLSSFLVSYNGLTKEDKQ